ncbi:hypothetical protein ACVWXP_006431 [Bradyrhizobium sp. USDA 4463]
MKGAEEEVVAQVVFRGPDLEALQTWRRRQHNLMPLAKAVRLLTLHALSTTRDTAQQEKLAT